MSKEAAIDREFDKRTEKLDFEALAKFIKNLAAELEVLNRKMEEMEAELKELK